MLDLDLDFDFDLDLDGDDSWFYDLMCFLVATRLPSPVELPVTFRNSSKSIPLFPFNFNSAGRSSGVGIRVYRQDIRAPPPAGMLVM